MKVSIFGIFSVLATSAFATENAIGFGQFENQFNLGYQVIQGSLINGSHNSSNFNANAINMEVEHLFNMGLWLDGNFNMVTNYSQPNLGYLNGGAGGNGGAYDPKSLGYMFGQDPFMFSLTVKVGYAFDFLDDHLQFIPYGMLGRTANFASSTIIANAGQPMATNDFFYSGALGARVAYRINHWAMVYFDQSYNYNWDNSGAIKSVQTAEFTKSYAATNYSFTSLLGAKFDVTEDFQVGLSAYWNNYQPQSNISGLIYTPTNTFGEMVTLGLTY